MKLAIAVGTRPEIVKMAPVIRAARRAAIETTLIHTGQHYSWAMDGVFFDELGLPDPDIALRIGSGTPGHHLSGIINRLEPYLMAERPDAIVVQGDTNSVLAVALSARTLQIPVAHVEAGLRSYDRSMPEETNRIVVDHLADRCFAPTERSGATLLREGVDPRRVLVTGNTVVDEILRQRPRAEALGQPRRLGLEPGRYVLATIHRAENTTDPARLRGILEGLARVGQRLGMTVVAPLHPRTAEAIQREALTVPEPVGIIEPMGYLEFLGLQIGARLTLTDSGGVQEEACALGVPCVTLRDSTERPESIEVGANVLAGWEPESILDAAVVMAGRPRTWLNPFGDGHSGERIISALVGAEATPASHEPDTRQDLPRRRRVSRPLPASRAASGDAHRGSGGAPATTPILTEQHPRGHGID
jgi:UDP-N-acetylglucosamine 2-epimerase (non-hydrolysing)